jgi:PAS domain S-box-containing protein
MPIQLQSWFKKINGWINQTTQRRLVIWSVGFWLISIIILSMIFVFVGQNQILSETRLRNTQFASTISRDVNAQLGEITANVRTFTEYTAAKSPDLETQAGALLGLRLASSRYKAIYYFDSNNNLLFDVTDTTANLLNIKTPTELLSRKIVPAGKEILETYSATLKEGNSISQVYFTTLDFTPVIDIGRPIVFPSGDKRIIVFEVDLTDIWLKINTATIDKTGVTYAVSREGKVIAYPVPEIVGRQVPDEIKQVLDNFEGSSQFTDPFTHETVIAAYSPVGGQTGWGIIVQQSRSEINSSISKTTTSVIFVLLVLGVFGTLSILFLIRGFTHPIKALTRTTREIALTGKLAKTGMEQRADEVGQLSQAFDQMIQRIQTTDGRLTSSEAKYRSLVENANDAIFLIDGKMFIDCNRKAEEMFSAKREQLLNKTPQDLSPEIQPDGSKSSEKSILKINAALAGGAQFFEWKHQRPNKSLFDAEVSLNRIDIENRPILMSIIRDISERKKAENELRQAHDELETRVIDRTAELRNSNAQLQQEIQQREQVQKALQESELKYRQLVENSNTIILEMDDKGRVIFFNKFAEDFFGFKNSEIIGRNVMDTIVPPQDSAGKDLEFMIEDIVSNPERYLHNENENIRKDGQRVWIIWTNQPVYNENGLLKKILCIGIDRTEQKKAEDLLATEIKEKAASEERGRLARDLHDAVSQTLFSASLIADVLPRIWEKNPDEGHRRLEEIRQLARGALAEMRTLLFELRPAALADAELGYLLHQLAESITGRSRIPVEVLVEGECDVQPEIKVALYRITQEALNNVAKHAGAKGARVNLRCDSGEVSLVISDNGKGFEVANVHPESLGLGIMRERARGISAELTIHSKIGSGSQIEVNVKNTSSEVRK